MAKKLFAVLFGFALAPAFIAAETTVGNTIAGTTCLVRVYHNNFKFPSQGGRIVQIGRETYFFRDYLPECQSMLPGTHTLATSGATNPVYAAPIQQPAVTTIPVNAYNRPIDLNGAYGAQWAGEPCAVRVYHTNFKFPERGGKIIQLPNNELYFVRTYMPGCENVGSGATVLSSSNSVYNPININQNITGSVGTTYYAPTVAGTAATNYVAPTTGGGCY